MKIDQNWAIWFSQHFLLENGSYLKLLGRKNAQWDHKRHGAFNQSELKHSETSSAWLNTRTHSSGNRPYITDVFRVTTSYFSVTSQNLVMNVRYVVSQLDQEINQMWVYGKLRIVYGQLRRFYGNVRRFYVKLRHFTDNYEYLTSRSPSTITIRGMFTLCNIRWIVWCHELVFLTNFNIRRLLLSLWNFLDKSPHSETWFITQTRRMFS